MTTNSEPKSELITLIDVAFAADDAGEKYGMKIGDHKLICSVLDAHLKVTKLEVNALNDAFHKKMIKDVVEVIEEQWIRVLKKREKRIIKIMLIIAFITFLLSVAAGVIASIYYHNHYLVTPLPKAMGTIFSILADVLV
jgi:hypothetical protein